MKTKVLLIAATLCLSVITAPAHATGGKTLVIIDTGINTNLPWVKSAVVEEACFIEFGRCPNGQTSMVGPGAAHLDPALVRDRALSHGTQMASVAVATNPNVKIVFVRVTGMTNGFANTYTTRVVATALNWVSANAQRLNVGAVSVSVGRTYTEATCPIEAALQTAITGLASANIPTVIAAGNNANQTRVNYPACIPEAIAVGATDTPYTKSNIQGIVQPIMFISNGSTDVDLYSLGRYTTTDINGVQAVTLGTSGATVSVATKLARSLSDGSSLSTVMGRVNSSLMKAYRSTTNFVVKYWQG
jgi:hypothetical protein